jgi:PPIC-type PPIASE domain
MAPPELPRWAVAPIAALVAAGLGFAVYRANQNSRVPEHVPSAKPALSPSASASAMADLEALPVEEAASAAPPHPFTGYDTLPDGRKVAALPDDAPRSVSFGVVLVTYRGAERAPASARPKPEALEMAKRLSGDAKANFEEAVKKGDPGSNNDAGAVPRGVLEPVLEYVLFTMKKGEVYSEPIDTPRGYWIVRRNQ